MTAGRVEVDAGMLVDDANRFAACWGISGFTPARLRGFRAVAVADFKGHYARESNLTDVRRRVVYWQTRKWLSQQGLIEPNGEIGLFSFGWGLSPLGRRLADVLGWAG